MDKVVTFGEIMLRLSTEDNLRFSQAKSFIATYGGGEFNVAASLVNYGILAEFVTRLPQNEMGQAALSEIRKANVDSSNIQFGGERLGTYYLEKGSGFRASNVIYDRAHSAMATIQKGTILWEEIFKNATWFHWSGITPAISQSAADVCLEAIIMAKKMGLRISCDLNYRSKLWQYGKSPSQIMPEMLQHTNVILGDIDTAFFMLGFPKVNPNYKNIEEIKPLYSQILQHCPSLKTIATTLRYSINASHQQIGGLLFQDDTIYSTETFDLPNVVDRVGTGDAFMGGLLYGLIKFPKDFQKITNFAVAACCLKHTISGDYNLATFAEVQNLSNGNTNGLVSR